MQQDLIENTNYLPLKLYSLILLFENTLIHLFCYIFVLLIVFGGASSLAFLEKKKTPLTHTILWWRQPIQSATFLEGWKIRDTVVGGEYCICVCVCVCVCVRERDRTEWKNKSKERQCGWDRQRGWRRDTTTKYLLSI